MTFIFNMKNEEFYHVCYVRNLNCTQNDKPPQDIVLVT